MNAASYNIVGLVMNLVGVILLFRYGMPYRISSDSGGDFIVTESSSTKSIQTDRIYKAIGFVGLALIVIGTGCQIKAVIS